MNATISEVAAERAVDPNELLGPDRAVKLVDARREIARRLRAKGLSYACIGRIMHRDHSTIMNLVGRIGK